MNQTTGRDETQVVVAVSMLPGPGGEGGFAYAIYVNGEEEGDA